MNNPLVSILVPIYNVELHIEKCIESLLNQTYNNIEFVFINDCTPDNSILILKKCFQKHNRSDYKLIENDKNRGVSITRNIGLKHVSGDYIIQVDSDDYLDYDAIEAMVAEAISSNAEIVISNQSIKTKNSIYEKVIGFDYDPHKYLVGVLLRKYNFNVPGKLIKAKLYDDLDFVENIDFGEDYLIYAKLLYKAKKISYVDRPLYYYVQTNIFSATKNVSKKSIEHMCKAQKCIEVFFKNKIDLLIIRQSTTQAIVHMIKSCEADLHCLMLINQYFSDTKQNKSKLSLMDIVVIELFNRRMYKILRLIFKLYKTIK